MTRHREKFGDPRHERGKSPLEILIAREAGTCKGCISIMKSPLGGPEVACHKRRGKAKKSVAETRRCEIYDDGKK